MRAVAGDVFLPRGTGLDRRTLLDLPGFARLKVTHCTYRPADGFGVPLPGGFETGVVTLTNTSSTVLNVRSERTSASVRPGGTVIVGDSNTTDVDLVLRGETARSPHASIDLDTTTTARLDCMHTATGVFDPRS